MLGISGGVSQQRFDLLLPRLEVIPSSVLDNDAQELFVQAEYSLGDPEDHVDRRLAVVGRRGDVEEHQLVGALGVVASRQLDGVAGVTQLDEVHALHDTAGVDVAPTTDHAAVSRASSAAPTA